MCGCTSDFDCCRNLSIGGAQLSAGADGAQIHFGTTVPAPTLGSEDDVYFRTNGPQEAYKKILGVWVLQGTV